LKPLGLCGGEPEQRRMRIVPAAEFPTDLVQAAFEMLRKHRQFRAAFVLINLPEVTPAPGQPRKYNFGLVLEPKAQVLSHDLSMTIAGACGKEYNFEISLLDAETTLKMFQAGTPFFMATDYQPPS